MTSKKRLHPWLHPVSGSQSGAEKMGAMPVLVTAQRLKARYNNNNSSQEVGLTETSESNDTTEESAYSVTTYCLTI